MSKKSTVDQIIDLLAALEREAYASGFEAGKEATMRGLRKALDGDIATPATPRMPEAQRKVPSPKHVPNGWTVKMVLHVVLLEAAVSSADIIAAVLYRCAGKKRPSDGSIYAAINRLVRANVLVQTGKGPNGVRLYGVGPAWNDFVAHMPELTPGERESLQAKVSTPEG